MYTALTYRAAVRRKGWCEMVHIFLGMAVALFGLFLFKCPETFYELTEGWKSSGGSPSDTYIRHTKFGGAVCMAVGIGCGIILTFFG